MVSDQSGKAWSTQSITNTAITSPMSECTESNQERERRPIQKEITPRGPVWKYEVLWLSSRKGLNILNATEIKRPRTIITSACCCHPCFPWLNLWSKGGRRMCTTNQWSHCLSSVLFFLVRSVLSFRILIDIPAAFHQSPPGFNLSEAKLDSDILIEIMPEVTALLQCFWNTCLRL